MPDLQKQIDGNKIFVCERNFKPEYILTCKYLPFMCALNYVHKYIQGPVVQSWVSANPGVNLTHCLVSVFLFLRFFQSFRNQN